MSIFRNLFAKKNSGEVGNLQKMGLAGLVNQGADYLDALQPIPAKQFSLRAIQIDPTCAQAWSNLGFADIQLGNLNDAEKALTQAITLAPTNANTWHNLGEVHMRSGNAEKSLECNNRAITIDPNRAHYWMGKGTALASLERFEEAVACFDKCIALHTQHKGPVTDFQFKVTKLNRDISLMMKDQQKKKTFHVFLGVAIEHSEGKLNETELRAMALPLSHQPGVDTEFLQYLDSFAQINILQRNPFIVSFCILVLSVAERIQNPQLVKLFKNRLQEAQSALK